MGMPVKLSDELVRLARAEAEAASRSLAAQVEHGCNRPAALSPEDNEKRV
ncbi:MAG: hypothetical protein AB1578_11510 [Thermodesulfobacteriota bacterium]